MPAPTLISRHKMFNGHQERYTHHSESCACEMTFAVYLPRRRCKAIVCRRFIGSQA